MTHILIETNKRTLTTGKLLPPLPALRALAPHSHFLCEPSPLVPISCMSPHSPAARARELVVPTDCSVTRGSEVTRVNECHGTLKKARCYAAFSYSRQHWLI